MSTTFKKSDGDLFIDPETGRPEVVSGANKVDQELADMYLTYYDAERRWGSQLRIEELGTITSLEQAQSLLYLRLQQANDRILEKQAKDPYLTSEEFIRDFSQVDVAIDAENYALLFFVVADVGDVTVTKVIGQDFTPTSLNHVIPPPIELLPRE